MENYAYFGRAIAALLGYTEVVRFFIFSFFVRVFSTRLTELYQIWQIRADQALLSFPRKRESRIFVDYPDNRGIGSYLLKLL